MACAVVHNSLKKCCPHEIPKPSSIENSGQCCLKNKKNTITFNPNDQDMAIKNCSARIVDLDTTSCVSRDSVPKQQTTCNATCCDSSFADSPVAILQPIVAPNEIADLEQGPPEYRKVILQVEGMDCTSCERNLTATVSQLKAAINVKTSFTLARAEFLLNTNRMGIDEAVINLQKTTKYTFKIVLEENAHSLTIIVDDARSFCQQTRPKGVLDMLAADKHFVELKYDASIIGARKLLEQGFGLPLSLAPDQVDLSSKIRRKKLQRDWIFFLVVAALTVPVLVFSWSPAPLDHENNLLYDGISMALATLVQLAVVWKFYRPAFQDLIFRHTAEVDMLVSLSTTAAYVFSAVSFGFEAKGNPLPSGQFFETSTLLTTIVLLSNLISEMARHTALKSVSIRSLQSNAALVVQDDGNTHTIDARLLQYGDIFRVTPHANVVTDGVIVRGETEIDESMLTGESKPINKTLGSEIIAGSTNGWGTIDVRITRLPSENTISTIAKLVDEAAFSKPPIQEIVNKVAGYFVPFMIGLTIVVFVVQILHRIMAEHKGKPKAFADALQYAIAVLIVSCPCAIALAVPMVVFIAGGVAAKHGVVLKDPIVLEVASKTSHVVFDKTGTLTIAELEVNKVFLHSPEAGSIVLGLTADINHPVAKAVHKQLQGNSVPEQIEKTAVLLGKGIEGIYHGKVVRGGNCRWLGVESNCQVQDLMTAGNTLFAVTMNEQVIAGFGLCSPIRPEAARVVKELQNRGITISIVSGDEKGAVESVAQSLDIPLQNVRSRCSPGDKQEYIREVLGPEHDNIVMFCGDGTNDAVALKQATIGVHMEGTDVAKSSANVVLVRPDLNGILNLLDISKAAYRRIWFNFAWSFVYNILAITMAAGAWERLGVVIKPQYAALGELVSVLPVIAIAVQLRAVRFGERVKKAQNHIGGESTKLD